MQPTNLSPIRRSDVIIGKPLPWPIYDKNKKLLLCAGFVVESFDQVKRLMDAGLYRIVDGDFVREFGSMTGNPVVTEDAPGATKLPTGKSPQTTFVETRLPVGTAVQLTNPENEAGGRETVRLIGYFDRKSLIVSHPTRDGQIMFVKEGASYRCRAFAGKSAYAFEATVLRVALAPYPYLHLSFPSVVHTNVVRKAARIPTEIVSTSEPIGGGQSTTCTIKDLSVAGALVHSKTSIGNAGQDVSIAFRLTIDEERVLFKIDAEIRSVQPGGESDPGTLKSGISFKNLDATLRREMEIYIYRQMVSDV